MEVTFDFDERLFELYDDLGSYTLSFEFEGVKRVVSGGCDTFRDGDLVRLVGEEFVVVMAMTACSMERMRGVVRSIRRFGSSVFSRCEIVGVGISSQEGYVCRGEALVYRVAEGVTLEEYLEGGVNRCDVGRVFGALHLLGSELERCGVTFDLAAKSIVVDVDGYFYPKYIETMISGVADLRVLQGFIEASVGVGYSDVEIENLEPYSAFQGYMLGGYEVCGYPHEGRIKVCDDNGLYGFVDECGAVIVTPQYQEAEDYIEGRSKVTSRAGAEVIDLWGEKIE